jgi:hypothetical protein
MSGQRQFADPAALCQGWEATDGATPDARRKAKLALLKALHAHRLEELANDIAIKRDNDAALALAQQMQQSLVLESLVTAVRHHHGCVSACAANLWLFVCIAAAHQSQPAGLAAPCSMLVLGR